MSTAPEIRHLSGTRLGMSDTFLDSEELLELTGYKRRADQIRWLQKNGIPHFVNSLGRPVVSKNLLAARQVTHFELGAVR